MKSRAAYSSEVHAIVPVKVLRASKARLAPVLSAENRRRLSTAMLADVLRALRPVRTIRRITVVSGDRSVRLLARRLGVHFLWEGQKRGLNRAVRLAIRDAAGRRAPAVLILPSDIPLISPKEIKRFLTESAGYSVSLTPSNDENGTNALLLRPPAIIDPAFGRNSFRRHVSSATRKGLPIKVVRCGKISSDVDEPIDLARLTRLHPKNETGHFLDITRNSNPRALAP